MADRHSIVVSLWDGVIKTIKFCDCIPPVSVEVRSYRVEVVTQPMEGLAAELGWPEDLGGGRWRDHEGTYIATCYDSDEARDSQ